MYSFINDYSETAHPRILAALARSNETQHPGYGEDPGTQRAAAYIRAACDCPDAQVHFLSGGTQVNLTAIASILRPYQAVIACRDGHINTHETGSVEATGHKIFALPGKDGKLLPEEVAAAVDYHNFDQMVLPKLVYISQSTEWGTVYTKDELIALREVCLEKGLFLFVDGARLGAALTAEKSDVSLADLARLTDAFYIGGTKNGALFGEAYVIVHPELQEGFRYHMRQRGALMAKGWIISVQFEELFSDGLYFDLARQANCQAARLRDAFLAKGYRLAVPGESNQLFPILDDATAERLLEKAAFRKWEPLPDGSYSYRLITSWATPDWAVDELIAAL